MTPSIRFVCTRSFLATLAVCAVALAPAAHGRDAAPGSTADRAIPPLIRKMAGTWDVQQRMWPGPGAKAIQLPPAVARRHLTGGAFLQETMTPAAGSTGASFTRIACFDYNRVNQQYEYFSLDTRAPQMMMEKSYGPGDAAHGVNLYGGTFVAPQWGKTRNAAFRYRLVVGNVVDGRQVVRLYLTPLSGAHAEEFLAFQYIYTRRG